MHDERPRRRAAWLLGVVAAAALSASNAAALSCAPPPPPAEALSSVAVVAKVRALAPPLDGKQRVAVVRAFKGDVADRIVLDVGTSPWARSLPVGEIVAVAGERNGTGAVRVSQCPVARGGAEALIEVLRRRR